MRRLGVKTLVVAPTIAILLSIIVAVGGGVVLSIAERPRLRWGGHIIMMEMLDGVLDIVTCSLTWHTAASGDNDPDYLLFKFVLFVAVPQCSSSLRDLFEMSSYGSSTYSRSTSS